jgi:hypothetical protein
MNKSAQARRNAAGVDPLRRFRAPTERCPRQVRVLGDDRTYWQSAPLQVPSYRPAAWFAALRARRPTTPPVEQCQQPQLSACSGVLRIRPIEDRRGANQT